MGVTDFKHDNGAWIALVLLTGVSLFLDGLLVFGVRKAIRSESFETTQGVVTRSETAHGHKGAVDYEIEYTYAVNGQQYTSKEYHVQPQFLGNGYWYAVRDSNPVGAQVTVYYDPADPHTAYLVPGLRSDLLSLLWFAMPWNLLAVGMWWGLLWYMWGWRAFDPKLSRCVRETPDGWLVRPDPMTSFVVSAFLWLLGTFVVGCFLTGGYTIVFADPPPLIVPLALYAVVPWIAYKGGRYGSQQGLMVINERESTVTFTHKYERITIARDKLLGIDIKTEPHKTSDGKPYETFVISLRWLDKIDCPQSTNLAEYDEIEDAVALDDWLREKLGLPGVESVAGG